MSLSPALVEEITPKSSPYLLASVHWCLKKKWFWTDYRMSRQSKIVRESEPFGDVLKAIVEMCMQMQESDVPYRNAFSWFAAILQEIDRRQIEILDIDKKNLALMKSAVQQFAKLQDPTSSTASPAFSLLISKAIAASSCRGTFWSKYWKGDRAEKGFLMAYRDWVSQPSKK